MFTLGICIAVLYLTRGTNAVVPESSISNGSVGNMAIDWAPAAFSQHEQVSGSLYDEVIPRLGEDRQVSIAANLPSFVSALHSMFAAMPKNEFGLLCHAATRLALNRLFVQRHGWFVNGIYAGLGTTRFNETSTTDALLQYVPPPVQHAFERRLSGRGLDEDDVALLAATIESVIFESSVQELRSSYELANVSASRVLSTSEFDAVMEFNMAMRITELPKIQPLPVNDIHNWSAVVLDVYPRWPQTLKFLHQLREELFPKRTMFGFHSAARMAREVESRWGRMTALDECQDMKHNLIALEEGSNTGCVRLSDFYTRSLDPVDGWQFKESPAYLKKIGALDSSDPSSPRIIIPNYVNSPAQCTTATKFYMTCCINECEDLHGQIERDLKMPDGSPEAIAAIIKKMLSKEGAQRLLSSSLLQRLIDIGEVHNGRVFLQSRLFAQWMHFVYPQKCPFPHVAGTTSDEAPDISSLTQVVDDETIHQFIVAGNSQTRNSSIGTCMAWRSDEEIFVPTLHPVTTSLAALESDASVWASVYFVALLMSASLYLARLLQMSWSAKPAKLEPKSIDV